LDRHPSAEGPSFAATVVRLFERLNERLRTDLGPQSQVGHSYFMVADLDSARLRVVWEHHVEPFLEEYLGGQAGRLANFRLDKLLEDERPRKRERRTAGV